MPYSINLNLKTQMKMKTTKYILTIALALVCTWSSSFAIDQTYYNSIDGKSGTTLRDALYTIASAGPKNMNYDKLWTAYKTTDVYPANHAKAGKIWDMYGGCTFTYSSDQCGNYDNVCDCYNREHSLPQSWFNKVSPADYDLGHIVPTDGKVNGMRSNYIFGEVGSGAATWGTGKLGNAKSITVENVKGSSTITTTITSTAFEPEDQYKGDFARMYMYMAVRYKHGNSNGVDLAASGDGKKMFNATDANYGLTDYSIALLMKWHRQDPVSKKEIDRNNGMQTVQGNRNPFIDYPNLAEYLWGNHAGETVTLASIDNTFGGEVSSYSISLYRNGETTIINNLSGSYTLPLKSAEDAACTSWAFDGWSATQISETNTKPDYVTTTSSAGIIYAVYAKTTISSAPKRAKKEDVTDNLTRATTGVTSGSTSYSNWSEKTVTSDAVYAGNSAGGNNAIQLRSNNSNSGIVTTASGGKAKKVTVTWHSETAAGRTLNIYGKNSAYSDATDLYSSSQGTLLGTIVKGTSTELTISGDYEYIGMRSSSGAMYLTSVSIMWSSGSGGGSTTYDSDPDDCHCTGNLATPSVTATPSDGTITLTWDNDPNATNGYTVTISKGVGYTTECGDSEIGAVTLSGSKNTCVITGLVNGLEYTTSVVANATSSICESAADEDTATPVGCESWADPTFTYSTPLIAGGGKVTPTIGAGYGTPTFMSSNTSVLQVDEVGKVAPISAGTATITAQWPGDGTHCPKDVVSNTITVKGIVILTFNANYEGADPATATQNFTYGEAQSMTANSFSRTGYTFQGWSTSPSGSKEYDDGASITITAATTLYAVWQVNKHSVTFSQPASGGTFTVNSSSSSPVTNVDFGSTVTINITPTNSHFTVNTVSVSGASGSVAVSGEGTSRTFAMPDEDVTVSVTMTEETKYTVNWYVNNSATPETNYAGETLVGIANPTIDCNGKAFQGWTATANYSSDDTAPGDLFTDASTKTMPINGTSFYAVFATETTSGGGSEGWSETAITSLTSSDVFVIVGTNNSGSRALPNTVANASPSASSVTISAGKITSTVGNNLKWNISGNNSEGFTFYPNGDSEHWLGSNTTAASSSNTNIRVGTANRKLWLFDSNDQLVTNDSYTDRYLALYNADDFRGYTSASTSTTTFKFYKYSAGSTTTISDYTTSCAAPTEVTVTFHANYEGADPATATQNIPYNTATALTANSFLRTGYSFQGWATSPSGSKEYDDGASVTLTSNTHLYAVWQKNSHDVIFTPAPTGATVTINGQSTSPQSVEYGETVTIVITPDATYDLSSVSATGVSLSGEGNTRTFTMPDADVTVTVIMTPKPTYTIQFFDNGTKVSEQNVVEGQAAVKPADPTPCDGYSFVGWWTETLAETNTTAETWVTNFTATQDQDYYAVFSRTESSGGGSPTTESYGFESTDDASNWEISGVEAYDTYAKTGSKSGKIARSSAGYSTITFKNKVKVTSFSYQFLRQTTNDNYGVYIETSTDKSSWTEVESYAMSSYTSKETWYSNSHSFDGTTELYVRFNCWTSTAVRWIDDISITYGGGSSTTYYTTSCAPCLTKVNLTKGVESHGEFTLNRADGAYNNCAANFVVIVSGITHESGYHCTGVTATGGHNTVSGPDGSGNYTVTYEKGYSIESTITANFEPNPTYAVTWSMDGDESTKVYYEEGQEIAFPTSATGCEDKTFMGWTAAAIANPQAEAPTYVTSATMGTSPITYYAVYAEEDEGGSGEIAKATSISVGDVVYLVYEEDKYELDGISTTSTKYGIGTSYTSTPNKLYPLEVVNGNAEGSVAFKNNDSYLNYSGSSNTLNKNATLSDNTSWTVTFSGGNAIIKNVNNTSRTIRWNSTSGQERFACYTSGMQPVQLYKSSTSYTNYTTTCGAGISAKNIGWITAAKGQKVKRVINVTAKGFDEATTLSATSGDAQFKVTLGASAVPAGKTGLSTTLTVEYTPTASDNRIANVEIVLTAGGITQTITVSGRSLPDEFLAITKKDDTWYALPANMNGGENQYEGVAVTPNDASEPTSVAVAPSTIVYSLHSAANSRYAENGAYVRLAGNGSKALWGNTTADAITIQNSETIDLANAENYEWSLTTTDGIHYTIANPHHADYASGRVLAYGDMFGLYKTSTVFFLVPAGCNSQPQEVNVSARRADATFSWVSSASSVTIDLYTDEGKTAFAKSATATSVPYYMTELEESTHYWYTLTPEGETACAVSGDFETSGPTIDVVEWKEDTVVIFVDKDTEFNPSVVIDGEVEHGAGTGAVATDIFFSKYFEAAASVKLLAVFNGTNANVDLSDYSLSIATNGGTFSHTKFEDIVKTDNTHLTAGELLLESGEELILITYNNTDNDKAIIKCAKDDEEHSGFSKYVRIKTPSLTFNGDDVIALKNPDGEFIDLIGASAGSSGDKTYVTSCSDVGASGCDFMDSPGGWYNEHGYQDKGTDAEESNYALATNRCLLIRRNHVTTGRTAVERNTTDFVTLGDYTHEAVNYQGEWKGVQIPGGTSSTTDDGIVNACTGFEHVGGFNYSEYYKGYETIETQTLDSYTHDEATKTYEIPIPELAKYSCLNIRFQLKNTAGEVVTEAPVQVPIIVKDGHTTIDAIFNEIVKTDGGDPLYDESIIRCKTCDVVVLGTGVLTKATDGSLHDVPEVGNVKVYPGGKLIVPEGTEYTVNSLAFRRQEDEVSTANIQGDLNIKATGNNVYLDLRIDPSNWHYISLPYNCNVSDIRFADDEVKIPVLGVDYLLKYYDGEKRAATQAGGCWEMVAADATLKKGIGYIFGIPGSGSVQREFRFPMSNAVVSEEKNDQKMANGVYAFGGDKDMTEVRANHRGWNLIGDPYLLPYTSDIEEPVMTGYIVPDYPADPTETWDGHYKFDPDPSTNLRYIVEPVDNGRSEYIQVAITDYNMKPFTSYFVQIGGSDPEAEQGVQFNLSKVDRSASPVRRAPAAYEEQEDIHPVWCAVNITSPKGETDETTMLISDQFTDGYDMMDDLVKMRGTYYQYAQITTKPVLASRNNEGEMAFNALPDASAEAGIPLHYFAATQGEYVLAYSDKYGRDEVKAVMLLDKQTNEWHDLMNAPYEFYTNRTDDKDRFVLTVRVERKNGPQITTDIDAASSADDRPRKILHKDHIYILRGDKIYDITGKEL